MMEQQCSCAARFFATNLNLREWLDRCLLASEPDQQKAAAQQP